MTAVRNRSPRRTTRPVTLLLHAVLVAAGTALAAGGAQAQALKPWVPPTADSLIQWATEAKVRFQANTGDSIGGANYRAYDRVGSIGRRLLRSLGKANLAQAHAIKGVLDSLGLDTDVAIDPALPHFVLLMVRNPYRRAATPVGFLYWYKENDLRIQGAQFQGGMRPEMRVWWTGQESGPYEWGVIDRSRETDKIHLTLFRLLPSGSSWSLIQFDRSGPDLGLSGSVAWPDINGDERPELVAWVKADADTLFEICRDCPRIVNEVTLTEGPAGFRLHDTRVVPSPLATFTLFIRLLLENNRAGAARLLKEPARLQEALAAGWGASRAAGSWKIEDADPGAAWPEWLMVRHRAPAGDKRYIVHFLLDRGRWVIRDWTGRDVPRQAPPPGGTGRP